MIEFLPFARPEFGDEEIAAVEAVMRSGWLTTGAETARFESDFAKYIGSRNAIAVNSATSGLHLALEAVGISSDDRVITTPYTFTATAEVIRYLGGEPLFVDIDAQTMNIDPVKVAQCANSGENIKAILPVHFAGQSCDMDQILETAHANKWKVVEDAAHALPTTWHGKMIGTLGDITVYSFYVTKTIATGEGGMVVTGNDEYAARIKTMRLHGIDRDVFDRYASDKPSWYYEVVEPGFKYNMTDIAAAIGIHQLSKAWKFQERRAWIAEQYNRSFSDLVLQVPYVARPDDVHAWHLYVIQLELENLKITRDHFIELMREAGIGTSVHFIPLHIHPYWRDRYGFKPDDFPVSHFVYQRAVSLPIYPKMTDRDVERVIKAVREILVRFEK